MNKDQCIKYEKEIEELKQKMEQNEKNNQEMIEKLKEEASQAKIALANSVFENEEKITELKQKFKKLTESIKKYKNA